MSDSEIFSHYEMFDTSLGPCALAWTETGICGVQLPEATPRLTAARIAASQHAQRAATIPGWVREAMDAIRAALAGQPADLLAIPLDLRRVTPFRQRVYQQARTVPAGSTRSYGQLAAAVGVPRGARGVGQAMAHNPVPLLVPCHRIVAADGRLTGFSAAGGTALKARLLELERQ